MRPTLPAFRNCPTLYQKILALTDFSCSKVKKIHEIEGTKKCLVALADGLEVEMVLLPMRAGATLCLSSQVGCRMGCAFCTTGKMGLVRNLTTAEIVSQVFLARHELNFSVRNIVFMGMGEPLDNYGAVMNAIKILTDMNGFGFGSSRITLSTCGKVEEIHRLTLEADPALNLAISLNGATDATRSRLMPINRRYNLASLHQAMEAYCSHPRRKILIAYVMIQGVTDSLAEAKRLAQFLQGLRVTINLIPFNSQSLGCFRSSTKQQIDAFGASLRAQQYRVFARDSKGEKILAACGQLGNSLLRKRKREDTMCIDQLMRSIHAKG